VTDRPLDAVVADYFRRLARKRLAKMTRAQLSAHGRMMQSKRKARRAK